MPLVVLEGPTIAAGESLSDGIDCSGGEIVRITMPYTWDNAPLSFQFSTDGNGYNELYHVAGEAGNFVSYEVVLKQGTPAHAGLVMPEQFGRGINFLKIRSGTRNAPVVQKEARTFAIAIDVPDDFA